MYVVFRCRVTVCSLDGNLLPFDMINVRFEDSLHCREFFFKGGVQLLKADLHGRRVCNGWRIRWFSLFNCSL